MTASPPPPSPNALSNCSALDWVFDQYRVKTDKRSVIVDTVNIVESLPALGVAEGESGEE